MFFFHGVGLFRRWSTAPQCLERHRPSPYARGAFKRTPLHWACASGHAVAAAFLLLCVPVSGHSYRLGMDAGLWSQTMPGSVGSGFSTGCFAPHGSLIPSNLSNFIKYYPHYIHCTLYITPPTRSAPAQSKDTIIGHASIWACAVISRLPFPSASHVFVLQ